jgi:hypothetical protein
MMKRLARRWRRRAEPIERPLRDELLSIEALEARAVALAGSLTLEPRERRRARTALPASRTTCGS